MSIVKLPTITKYTNPSPTVKNITTYYTLPNQPPTLSDIRLQASQDTIYAMKSADITGVFTDVESSSPLAIKIISTPNKGLLKIGSVEAEIGDVIQFVDIATITYTPPEGAFGIDYNRFKIQVNDDGIAPNPYSETVKVFIDIESLLPPVVQDNCISVMEGVDYQFLLVDFSIGYQDDNTTEPEFISFQPPTHGQLINMGMVMMNAFTIEKAQLPTIQYRPSSELEDEFIFQVGDDQGLFSDEKTMCIKVKTIPQLQDIHNLMACYNDPISIMDEIQSVYSNGDGSGIKSIEFTFLHSGYTILNSGVTIVIGDIVLASDFDNVVLIPSTPSITLEFRYVIKSENDIYSSEATYLATIGEIADYDCSDYDENDYFVFDQ